MKLTYLYVKVHRKTGLKYFGKTVRDPFKYPGSGKYWRRHLKVHDNDVHTFVLGTFDNEVSCVGWATLFSKFYSITESNDWANLRDENGRDGAPVGHEGHKFSTEELAKISSASRQLWQTPKIVEQIKKSQKASWTPERKAVQRELNKAAWTPERRKQHSERIKQLREEGAYDGTASKAPKSPEHRKKISQALKGKPKGESNT